MESQTPLISPTAAAKRSFAFMQSEKPSPSAVGEAALFLAGSGVLESAVLLLSSISPPGGLLAAERSIIGCATPFQASGLPNLESLLHP
jgi:hypothetical protein